MTHRKGVVRDHVAGRVGGGYMVQCLIGSSVEFGVSAKYHETLCALNGKYHDLIRVI